MLIKKQEEISKRVFPPAFLLDENIFAKTKFYKLDLAGVGSAQMEESGDSHF
jgi:hypothetical protein